MQVKLIFKRFLLTFDSCKHVQEIAAFFQNPTFMSLQQMSTKVKTRHFVEKGDVIKAYFSEFKKLNPKQMEWRLGTLLFHGRLEAHDEGY